MAQSPDYYSVLGVDPTADRKAIHAAWKALLRRYHPDANPDVDVSARAKEINEAYAVLGKVVARAAYDRSRPSPTPSSPPRPAGSHRFGNNASRKRPMRPGASPRPTETCSAPLDAGQWMMGLFLLLLSAAPLGMILVLHHEEAGSRSSIQRAGR